jgi:hypothetical protein
MKILILLLCFVLAACVVDRGRGYGYDAGPGYGYGPTHGQRGEPGHGYRNRSHDDQGGNDRDRNDPRRDGGPQGNWGR